jgi:hypothetical protein
MPVRIEKARTKFNLARIISKFGMKSYRFVEIKLKNKTFNYDTRNKSWNWP